MSGAGNALPYFDRIQAAFGGTHDLSQLRAHVGGEAAAASEHMGADAYATGNHVAFREPPDLHTAAHEAAHVVQQRAGVQLNGGVGQAGDAYEQQADQVADAVVAGRSAAALLEPKHLMVEGASGTIGSVQAQAQESEHGHEALADGLGALQDRHVDFSQVQATNILESSHPDVNGRTVASVGADLRARAQGYRDSASAMSESAEGNKHLEEEWYAELGLIGGFIDLFNEVDQTDPRRWDVVQLCWENVAGDLDRVLALHVRDDSINELGLDGERAIQRYHDAHEITERTRAEFMRYLRGFEGSAEGALSVTTIVRDVSFAAAVGIAVVMAAPVVFGAAGSFATGTLGLSGASSTIFAGGTTAVAMGGLGAGIEGGGQTMAALVVEGSQLVNDLMSETMTWEQAIDGFDWDMVAGQGWDGFKRGFVDGVLAYAGMGFEKVLHRGAQVALDRILGEAGGHMLAQILRRAMERAMASGAAGGVIGALDAGIKTSMAGGSVDKVLRAVRDGFVIGAAVGTTMGMGGGALEGRRALQLTAEVDELQRLLREEPEAFAARFNELVATMSDEQRAAFQRELQGRRFVDAQDYGPAAESFDARVSSTPPEHRYGQQAFEDWSEAARLMDEHSRSGQPLTQSDLMAAHARASRNLTGDAGNLRSTGTESKPLIGSGGIGLGEMFSALSPEQIAILNSNPHLRLHMRGMSDFVLTPEQVAAGFETAIIAYPNANELARRLDDFFSWYAAGLGAGDPVVFAAEAQRRLVSIHPFADGNGRLSRLVMDHALQVEGLPPSLLRDPDLDYMVTSEVWAEEVRRGVLETYHTAARHAGLFNEAVRHRDLAAMAMHWAAIVGLAGSSPALVSQLYDGVCE